MLHTHYLHHICYKTTRAQNRLQNYNNLSNCKKIFLPFLYKSNIPSMREISKSGHGITGAYGKPATLMEGG